MSGESSFIEAVEKVIKDTIPVFITEGTVSKVNADSVDVEREDLPELFKVRLNAVLEPGDQGVLILPKVGSKVLCGLVENNPNDAFIINATEVESITIHGGVNGGLTITPTLVEGLNKTNSYAETLKTATKGIATALDALVPGTSAAFETAMTGQAVGDFSKIENEKITH